MMRNNPVPKSPEKPAYGKMISEMSVNETPPSNDCCRCSVSVPRGTPVADIVSVPLSKERTGAGIYETTAEVISGVPVTPYWLTGVNFRKTFDPAGIVPNCTT